MSKITSLQTNRTSFTATEALGQMSNENAEENFDGVVLIGYRNTEESLYIDIRTSDMKVAEAIAIVEKVKTQLLDIPFDEDL